MEFEFELDPKRLPFVMLPQTSRSLCVARWPPAGNAAPIAATVCERGLAVSALGSVREPPVPANLVINGGGEQPLKFRRDGGGTAVHIGLDGTSGDETDIDFEELVIFILDTPGQIPVY